MAGSQLSVGGGIPGLSLRAWALVDGATGNLIKGMNVSAAARSSAGSYSLTLVTPMPDVNVVVEVSITHQSIVAAMWKVLVGSAGTGAVYFSLCVNGAAADPTRFWVGVYG